MKHILTFSEFLNEGKSISDLSTRDEQPMIKGIAEIINRVKDPANKKEMIDASIEDFKREGIKFDYEEFRDICNEDSAGTFELEKDWIGKDIHGKKVTLKKGTKLKHERSGGFGQDYMKAGSIVINGDEIDQEYLSAPW